MNRKLRISVCLRLFKYVRWIGNVLKLTVITSSLPVISFRRGALLDFFKSAHQLFSSGLSHLICGFLFFETKF